MKIQLLLLLVALAGPFTLASPAPLPADDSEDSTGAAGLMTTQAVLMTTQAALMMTREEFTVVTGAEKIPTIMPEVYVPKAATVGLPAEDTHATLAPTTQEYVTEVYVASTAAVTEASAVETAVPAVTTAVTKAVAEVTAAVETKPTDKVVIEEGPDGASEGLSSGQVAGIVIGALLAVVIVIAVVIAAVRRMGKYSP